MMRIFQAFFALIFLMLSGASCMHQTSEINVAVEEVNEKQKPVPGFLDYVAIRLVLIKGSIFGGPDQEDILVDRAEVGSVVALNTERLLEMGALYASPVVPDAARAGLVVEPAHVRFVRLGSYPTKPLSNYSIGSGSFLDKQSGDFLALLYVDGPCLISGTMRMRDIEARVHIAIDKAGLHWVKMKEVAPSVYELSNANPLGVIFGIHPHPVPSIGPGG